MLKSLSIKNYALIEDLNVDFQGALSIITGETGAGKSILLGGLALVLGKRADSSLVYDKEKKCVIEAEFEVSDYDLSPFFEVNDLDYDRFVIIRREVLPNGKSRAFVNDTPVNLILLKKLSEQLIDIHSQHETLQLSDTEYQFHIIDSIAGNESSLIDYNKQYKVLKMHENELEKIHERQLKAQQEYDYNVFVWNELDKANLKADEQAVLEKELEILSHVEEIKANISEVIDTSVDERVGILNQLAQMDQNMSRIADYSDVYGNISDRIKSLLIELKDIVDELESENDSLVHEPDELLRVEERLQLLFGFQKKHLVDSVDALLEVKDTYEKKVVAVDDAEVIIKEKQLEIEKSTKKLNTLAKSIHTNRKKAIPSFVTRIESVLADLEMKNTRFKIELNKTDGFLSNGYDQMEFLMSSDKGKTFEKLKRVASGGEMSRIMLGVKYILSGFSSLPAIIFDEIDTGVSGEVSNKIGDTMLEMSKNMQVITITHLPQVAAKGTQHYKVYKQEKDGGISTNIKILDGDGRLVELAEMLGGNRITDSALAHARQLLS